MALNRISRLFSVTWWLNWVRSRNPTQDLYCYQYSLGSVRKKSIDPLPSCLPAFCLLASSRQFSVLRRECPNSTPLSPPHLAAQSRSRASAHFSHQSAIERAGGPPHDNSLNLWKISVSFRTSPGSPPTRPAATPPPRAGCWPPAAFCPPADWDGAPAGALFRNGFVFGTKALSHRPSACPPTSPPSAFRLLPSPDACRAPPSTPKRWLRS